MNPNPPPIVPAIERLMVEIERAVAAFPRKHKYLLGLDLRGAAQRSHLSCQHAWRAQRDPARQLGLVGEIIQHNDHIKLCLQTSHRLQCFTSYGLFTQLATLASDVGRQAGGWHKSISKAQHLNGQNQATVARPERPETLSTRGASAEAQA